MKSLAVFTSTTASAIKIKTNYPVKSAQIETNMIILQDHDFYYVPKCTSLVDKDAEDDEESLTGGGSGRGGRRGR